ncbi:MAG: glucose-1-phosphate cytidylyltransferase [Gammaproteobacteria bacterium]|nr:glucose-1-phosphate cytidylyltransferase [Gammaproteobacteria bacterium]
MKVVFFCGGQGTRFGARSDDTPKPLAKIGGRPMLWHLMKYYSHFGHTHFILCLGHKGDLIKRFFVDHGDHMASGPNLANGDESIEIRNGDAADWRITFAETGPRSSIAERLWAVRDLLRDEALFLANYSDGLTDLPLNGYLDDFAKTNSVAGFISVRDPQTRHMVSSNKDGTVTDIRMLRDADLWVNGGFFIMRQAIFDYATDGEDLVDGTFQRLIEARRLFTHRYQGFWTCVDTAKDLDELNRCHDRGDGPWEVWNR